MMQSLTFPSSLRSGLSDASHPSSSNINTTTLLRGNFSSGGINSTVTLTDQCRHLADDDADGQLYVNLNTFWYCFLAFITTIGLMISLVSNMIIIYLFTG